MFPHSGADALEQLTASEEARLEGHVLAAVRHGLCDSNFEMKPEIEFALASIQHTGEFAGKAARRVMPALTTHTHKIVRPREGRDVGLTSAFSGDGHAAS